MSRGRGPGKSEAAIHLQVVLGACGAIGLSSFVVAQADELVAAVDAFAIAGACGRFDRDEGHEDFSGGIVTRCKDGGNREKRRKRSSGVDWDFGRGSGRALAERLC